MFNTNAALCQNHSVLVPSGFNLFHFKFIKKFIKKKKHNQALNMNVQTIISWD